MVQRTTLPYKHWKYFSNYFSSFVSFPLNLDSLPRLAIYQFLAVAVIQFGCLREPCEPSAEHIILTLWSLSVVDCSNILQYVIKLTGTLLKKKVISASLALLLSCGFSGPQYLHYYWKLGLWKPRSFSSSGLCHSQEYSVCCFSVCQEKSVFLGVLLGLFFSRQESLTTGLSCVPQLSQNSPI